MAGGLEAITAMHRRLLTGNSATEEGSVSTTHSNKDIAQGTSEVVKTGLSPSSSPPRKKQWKKKEGFKASEFISSCLMSEETEGRVFEFAVEDELIRIQKMMLRLAVLSYDVGREIPNFQSTIASKDKAEHESAVQIKSLKATLATLQEENKKLENDAKSAN
ncbi:hypothetical protein PIB30_055674 [Stylosanthes scabra]|uniref:Uncharacterized protein n=1 Tax=Stylosanthes scabra TaxID=79078 RepID=A0ABU6ZHT8_9FABA|nr:hypothetical protein [Stylosanthes scabra]